MRTKWHSVLGLYLIAALAVLWNAEQSYAWWGVGIWLLLGALGGILLELDILAQRKKDADISRRFWRNFN